MLFFYGQFSNKTTKHDLLDQYEANRINEGKHSNETNFDKSVNILHKRTIDASSFPVPITKFVLFVWGA